MQLQRGAVALASAHFFIKLGCGHFSAQCGYLCVCLSRDSSWLSCSQSPITMREIVHLQAGQCGNQIGSKVRDFFIVAGLYIFSICVEAAPRLLRYSISVALYGPLPHLVPRPFCKRMSSSRAARLIAISPLVLARVDFRYK